MLLVPQIPSILAAILLVLIVALIYKQYTILNHWKTRGVPFVKPVPIFGNLLDVVLRKVHLNEQVLALYSTFKGHPYMGMFIFNRPYLMIRDPTIIKRVLIKDFGIFPDRGITVDEKVDPLASRNLFVSKGEAWKVFRRKLTPVFSSGKMRLMFPLIEACCKDLVAVLEANADRVVDMKELMTKYTIDVISVCAFGFDSQCLRKEDSMVYKMASRLSAPDDPVRNFAMMCMFFLPAVSKLLKLTVGDPHSMEFFDKLFNRVIEERKKNGPVKNDFVDSMLDVQKMESSQETYKMDQRRMTAEALSFFFAGNDTTSTTLSFLINEVVIKTDVEDRMRKEIMDVEREYGKLTYENLQHLKYMDAVIKETQRKYPVAAMIFRQSSQPYTFAETGLTIEKGTRIAIPLAGLHYDAEYHEKPEEFNPDRFYQRSSSLTPYTLLPFGDGPRICIGERFATIVMKTALYNMLREVRFSRCDATQYPIEVNRVTPFLQPKNGVPVKVLMGNS